MTALLSAADYQQRVEPNAVPHDDNGSPDLGRIDAALQEATGLIVMHCPFILTDEKLADPLPLQFAEGLKAVCIDLARHRLADTLRDNEDARLAYKESIRMLERINQQHEVTLATPAEQCAEIIDSQGEALSTSTLVDEFFGPPSGGMW